MRKAMLIAALIACGGAEAQTPTYGPDQLPEFHGKVEAFKLTSQDELDGFFLDDGIEVHLASRLSSELAYVVKPGDQVTIHGLRSRDGQMIQAFSVINEATGLDVSDVVASASQPTRGYPAPPPRFLEHTGRIKRLLHGINGEFVGLLLDDGTNVRLASGLGEQNLNCLAPGREIAASGIGVAGALGKAIETRSISLITAVSGNTAGPQRCIVYPGGQAATGCRC
jgi:hypothetical protein